MSIYFNGTKVDHVYYNNQYLYKVLCNDQIVHSVPLYGWDVYAMTKTGAQLVQGESVADTEQGYMLGYSSSSGNWNCSYNNPSWYSGISFVNNDYFRVNNTNSLLWSNLYPDQIPNSLSNLNYGAVQDGTPYLSWTKAMHLLTPTDGYQITLYNSWSIVSNPYMWSNGSWWDMGYPLGKHFFLTRGYRYTVKYTYSKAATPYTTVTSTSSGAYPQNGQLGNNWYVYKGVVA